VTRLVVIRGNSGSGKTTAAHALREALNQPAMVIEQDHFRRIVLKEKENAGSDAVELIRRVAEFGLERGYIVIVEGILGSDKYGPMIAALMARAETARAFYFDVSFEETLRRHATKPSATFGEAEMRAWWRDRDLLGVPNETVVDERSTLAETVGLMLA
jgi:predicted kinase